MAKAKLRLALVTGAAQRIGRAISLSLARSGYALLLHYMSSKKQALELQAEVQSIGVPAFIYQADLTHQSEVDGLFSYIDSLGISLSVVVNSASVMHSNAINDPDWEEWDSTLALNLRVPFMLAQKASTRMVPGGSIINLTDVGAKKTWTKYPAYVTSKSALETLTRLLAKSYAPNIRVNAIAPGLVLRSRDVTSEEWNKLISKLPLRRAVTVDEITSAVSFILSDQAVTGQVIVVDAGYSL